MTHPPRCRDKTLADAIRVQSFSDGVNWMGVIDPAQKHFPSLLFYFLQKRCGGDVCGNVVNLGQVLRAVAAMPRALLGRPRAGSAALTGDRLWAARAALGSEA